MAENLTEITLQDLRAIVHGLKMTPLAFVEEAALDEIEAMIKVLPGPESINSLDPMGIKQLQSTVGNIMRLIELYGNRDGESKTRYESRTGLPPRYKVLEWRSPMNQLARAVTRGIIKTSAVVDDLGYSDISRRLIRCAKQVQDNKLSEIDLAKITADTLDKIGFSKEAASILKTAQTIELGIDDITGGLNQLYQVIDTVIADIQRKSDSLINIPTAKNAIVLLGKLWQQLEGFRTSLQQPVSQLQQEAPAIEQALESTVPKSVFDAVDKQTYDIEWGQPDESGEQLAYVTKADGQRYEVQRETDGRMVVSDQPIAIGVPAQTQTAPAPAQTAPAPAPAEMAQQSVGPGAQTSQQGQRQRLEDLNEEDLTAILQKNAPNRVPQYRQTKPQLIKLIQDNVGNSVLERVYNLDVAASKVFNLKKYSGC